MSVREEDRKKTASTSRGLGLATAAIGLGVGAAALYYFLNKGTPNQETEGASGSVWSYERANNLTQEDRLSKLRQRAFRERPWTLEECSICFEVMLRDQEIMTLSCTHNFHAQCIMPWLQEKQTCPNCRKHAE